jgi:large subunit ribosomal protein L3
MSGFILGEKSQQKQVFAEDGSRWPVTLVKTNNCFVIGIKTKEKDGYFSVKLGFKEGKNIKNPVKGELKKAGIKTPLRFLKEIRLDRFKDINVVEEDKKIGLQIADKKIFIGDLVNPIEIFKKGDKINVSGQSKGKGFQGVVKRHGFKGGPKTHGQSDRWRAPGSIGQSTTPGRVYKGKKMAGRMGGDRITVRNLEVYDITEEGLFVKGLVPGGQRAMLEIVSAN